MKQSYTRYKPKFIKKIDEYLLTKKDDQREGLNLKVNIPSIEDFATYIKCSRKALYLWEKNNEKFAFALDKIRLAQQKKLIENGLSGKYNASIVKLLLMAGHNMRERTDVTTDEAPLNPFSDEQVDRIAERIARRKKSAGDQPSEK